MTVAGVTGAGGTVAGATVAGGTVAGATVAGGTVLAGGVAAGVTVDADGEMDAAAPRGETEGGAHSDLAGSDGRSGS